MESYRTTLAIAALLGASAFITACGSTDELRSHDVDQSGDSTLNEVGNVPVHNAQMGGGDNGLTDPSTKFLDDQLLGTPDQVARMHGVQKISYAALGTMLSDLGVTTTATATAAAKKGATAPVSLTAGSLYTNGASALGAPIYASRVAEMLIPSTASLAKQFDIFMAAASEIVANASNSKRCAGVTLVTNNALTEDGISCLIGKPATAEHMQLAQDAVSAATDPTTGVQIAVATLLAGAHVSE